MKLKKSQRDVQAEIEGNAKYAAHNILCQLSGGQNNYGSPMGNITELMSQAIAAAVAEGFRVMIQNQYTDEDFERDLTLE